MSNKCCHLLQFKCDNLQAKCDKLQAERDELQAELEKRAADVAELAKQKRTLNNLYEESAHQINDLTADNKDAQHNLKTAHQELQRLEKNVKDYARYVDRWAGQRATHRNKIEALSTDKAELLHLLDCAHESSSDCLSLSINNALGADETIARLENELATMKGVYNNAMSLVQGLTNRAEHRSVTAEDCDAMRLAFEQAETNMELVGEVEELTGKVEKLAGEVEMYSEQLQHAQEEISDLADLLDNERSMFHEDM
jgi:chromosome segregation ATPase